MNEQDFIRKIDQKTNDIQIPDSISPENMEKMLNEHLTNNDFNADNTADKAAIKKHKTHQLAIAACAAICIFGGMGTFALNRQDSKSMNETASSKGAISDQSAFEAEVADADSEATQTGELAYHTNLNTPTSYEAYYEAIEDAYQTYYNSISTVITDTEVMVEDVAEESADSAINSATQFETAKDFSANTQSTAATRDEDFSKTNTQESNIEEGDVIKTDGSYIYKLCTSYDSANYDTLYRLSITKAENGILTEASTINLSKNQHFRSHSTGLTISDFYIHNNQLITVSTENAYENDHSKTVTYIDIYNIKDKTNPVLVQTLSQTGWYESSRISDGFLYTISCFATERTGKASDHDAYLPFINEKEMACDSIYYPDNTLLISSKVITALDLSNPKDFTDSKCLVTDGSTIYMSDNAIYLYATVYGDTTETAISKIYYKKGKLTIGNSAKIAGYLYGPFAINEYNNHLRIVATIPANNIALLRAPLIDVKRSSNNQTEDINTLYVLDDSLELVGKLAGLAPGEIIYSARFTGDIGYFVTYKNTDPLFSVDLSNPTSPELLGSLKIPGFSNYLHPYGKDTLLGLGEETDPKSQEFLGIKLSMFDISDPTNVTEQDKHIIQNAWASEALYNYKALMIDPEKNIFGFVYNTDTDTYYATYAYDEKYGFIETARYLINDGSEYDTDAIRGLFIGDYFYLATNRFISSYKLGDETLINSLKLFDHE